ncbi:uncharacterized protein N7483_004229 [Penicillium malachiteum]|uniref:uncharacterized protein n=1 Tax=Penicillium malachiteum TaxID=1324776 RepID=UPI0025486EB0|nr:uncharacterized protein N7483_004229 [Penicillium malachiteum]KAJ5729721.1 hypothetical protein N7483_004229 [Penicillium malachiteum]
MGDNPPSRASLESHQTDLEGHYVGPSSGVSFLIRVQRKLYKHLSLPLNTPIFTFEDTPLPVGESTFMLLPVRNEADMLVARYFDFTFPTHRFLHQQQVESWVDEFYCSVLKSEAVGPGVRGKRALVAASFAASEQQLVAETGPIRLTSVQARLAQCFYLLSQSRINHCWSLFGTTARLAMAIGLHRNRKRETGAGVDYIDSECRKRVLWCAYSLDNYPSAALGRPRIFHDDDIDQDFPGVIDDSRILRHQILPSKSTAQSIMLAPLYHDKLSVIVGRILRDMYGPHKATSQEEEAAAAQHGADLTRWRQEISGFLDSSNVDLLILIYQCQYTVLNLAFYHAQILLYRPFLIKHFGNFVGQERSQNNVRSETSNQYVDVCITAATNIAAVVHELCEKHRMYSMFWFTHYYAFSAIMVLYVRVIQLATQSRSPEETAKYLQIGEQSQRDLASCCSQSSFVQRYLVVLEELRHDARSAMEQYGQHPASNITTNNIISFGHANQNIRAMYGHEGGPPAEFEFGNGLVQINNDVVESHTQENERLQGADLSINPSRQSNTSQWIEARVQDNSPMDGEFGIPDWEHLDSLAVAGMGELDVLFFSWLAIQRVSPIGNCSKPRYAIGRY